MRIKNWEEFQHFKDRNPIWIKLYRKLLDDKQWHALDPQAAKVLIMLWLLASETHGELPDSEETAFRLRIPEKTLLSMVSKLSHWLVQDDINLISSCHQVDISETETETEKEKERDPGWKPDIIPKRGKRPISDEDKPTEKHFAYGKRLGVDVGPEWGKFVSYCKAHDRRYADFDAAFRNWLANATKFKGGPHVVR